MPQHMPKDTKNRPSEEKAQPRQLSKRAQTARYVVSVDHQAKSSYDNLKDAEAEAKRISEAFPVLNVQVADIENDTLKPLAAQFAAEDLAAEQTAAETSE